MSLRRALAPDRPPAAEYGVGLAATPPARRSAMAPVSSRSISRPTLGSMAAALLLAPVCAFGQQPTALDTTTAPAPAAHENAETLRRPGETTTGRPPAPAVPAPATTPAATVPPTAPLPGDAARAVVPTPPVASAPVSTTTSAPLGEAPRVSLPTSAPAPSGAGFGAAGLLQTILALMLVLGLLAGLAWVMKRYGPRMSGGNANLRVVGALNLGGRERIMVVEVGDQWIVVGAAPGRVNALHTMPRQEGALAPTTSHGGAAGGNPGANFSDWLKKTIDKRNAN